tara:strand:+ start:23674 stop:23907 length:234 start_codon:yes stop_codon:yes gene_type:complete
MFDFNVMTNRAGDTVASMFCADGAVNYCFQFNGSEGVASCVMYEQGLGDWVTHHSTCYRWYPGIDYDQFTEEELALN